MAQPMGAKLTTDHNKIKDWAEERGGQPEIKVGQIEKPEEVITIGFNKKGREKDFKTVSWEEFFKAFENEELAFLYQDRTADGDKSNFFKVINR